jgi:hypothetical protein
MDENPNIKFTIAFNDPDLDSAERDEQARDRSSPEVCNSIGK